MITIQFRDHSDAITVFNYLHDFDKRQMLKVGLIEEPEALVKIAPDKKGVEVIPIIIIALTKFIMTDVEGKWMKEMIRSLFYYSDIEEQGQIMSIARSILDGEKEEIPGLPHAIDNKSRMSMINEAFSEFITESVSFSFESFLQFRLKEYRSRLLAYVERAIDEYKMEQEYQTFIDSLRNYVQEKKTALEIIYVLYTDSFYFFDKHFRSIETDELKHRLGMDFKKQLDVDSDILEQLLSLAPKTIHLYTNKCDVGIVRTIQNVFQERVILYPEEQFRFQTKRL